MMNDRVPHCYYGDIDDGERFVLLLENLAPAQAADTVAGCSQTEAEQAMRQIATFHATWWEHPQLAGMDWLLQSSPAYFRQITATLQTLFQQKWEQFLEKAGHNLSHPMQTFGKWLIQHYVNIAEHLYLQPPQTLIHHDFQLSNLLYATPQDSEAFTVIDWQQIWLGRGTHDVAFFLCRCLLPEDRQTIEKELLKG